MRMPFMDAFRHNEEKPLPANVERIQYALDIERTLHKLEPHIHDRNDYERVIPRVLKTAREFYQADWAGFVDVDLELKLWTPYVWDNPNPGDRTTDLIQEAQSGEFLPEWLDALGRNHAIILNNLDHQETEQTREAKLYRLLSFKNIMAVPVSPQPNGFFVIRNPSRYSGLSSMLSMLSFVLMTAINEKKKTESLKMAVSPEHIEDTKEVFIKMFSNLEISTSRGIMKEIDIKSPKMCRLLTYMLLSKSRHFGAGKLIDALWPDEQATERTITNLIYRFRQSYSLLSDYRLIESSSLGYHLNPALKISTDVELFDKYYKLAQQASETSARIEFLWQAFSLYKGDILEQASGEHWLMSISNHYATLYEKVVNSLMEELAEVQDYHCLQHVATETLMIKPLNRSAHYWLIYAVWHSGAMDLARKQLQTAYAKLIEDDFCDLKKKLNNSGLQQIESLFI